MAIRIGIQLILAIALPLIAILWAVTYENRNFFKKLKKSS